MGGNYLVAGRATMSRTFNYHRYRLILLLLFAIVSAAAVVLALPRWLVMDNAKSSDYIVVLDGHDNNYFVGLDLLRKGFGNRMLVCLDLPDVPLEGEELRDDREFIQRTAGTFAPKIDLCANQDEDIFDEMNAWLTRTSAQSVLIVTPEAQSRAQYVAAYRRLPQYSWSVRPSSDSAFDIHWWRRRIWTKTFMRSFFDLWAALRARERKGQVVQRSAN